MTPREPSDKIQICKESPHDQPLPTSPTVSPATLWGHPSSGLPELLSDLQVPPPPRLAHPPVHVSSSLGLELPMPCVLYAFSSNLKTPHKAFPVNGPLPDTLGHRGAHPLYLTG